MVFYKRHKLIGRDIRAGFTLVEAVVSVTLIGIGVATSLGALTKFNSRAAMSRNATGAAALLTNQVDLFQSMSPFNPQRTPAQIPQDTDHSPPSYDMTVGTARVIGYQDPTTGSVIDPCSLPAPTATSPESRDTWPVYREPARWTYANAAARAAASGFTASDAGYLAYQSDTQTYWRLVTAAPTWAADTTGGIIVKGTMTCTVTDISDNSTTPKMNRYKGVFTLGYTFGSQSGGRGGPIWNPTYKPCGSAAAVGRWEYQITLSAVRSSDI